MTVMGKKLNGKTTAVVVAAVLAIGAWFGQSYIAFAIAQLNQVPVHEAYIEQHEAWAQARNRVLETVQTDTATVKEKVIGLDRVTDERTQQILAVLHTLDATVQRMDDKLDRVIERELGQRRQDGAAPYPGQGRGGTDAP